MQHTNMSTPTYRNRMLLAELNKIKVVDNLSPVVVKGGPMTKQQIEKQFRTTANTTIPRVSAVDTIQKTLEYEDENSVPDDNNSNILEENSPPQYICDDLDIEEADVNAIFADEESPTHSNSSDESELAVNSIATKKRGLITEETRFDPMRKKIKTTELAMKDITNLDSRNSSQQFEQLLNIEKDGHTGMCCGACNNKLDLVLEKLNEHNELLSELIKHKNPGGLNNQHSYPDLSMLPVNDLENLLDFDDSLQSDKKIEEQLRQLLMTLGGKTLHNAVDRAMSKILTNEICKSVSWSGTSGTKKVLMVKTMNFPKIVQDIVQLKTGEDADAVERKIKDWLRRASDRMRSKKCFIVEVN